ncbi:Alpha/Beta hydrolase protein [Aspergillus pseudodeflectus]|uniref:Alpha/Beta hydrolase protein n=1 Tax=Aspergillus pseudodeflectus TaxID=176178 RepID=A0ABR4JN59_9EURO
MLLLSALRITRDALFTRHLPLRIRLLMLTLQPITLLTYTIEWLTARKFPHQQDLRIPLKRAGKGGTVRAVVYLPPARQSLHHTTSTSTTSAAAATTTESSPPEQTLKSKIPLHLNIHGGAFLGGLPEGNARFCAQLARESGAVVVSTGYRYTPVARFPDAHEDVQDVAEWLLEHAEEMWGADPGCFTVSGFSVGGNLGLGVAQSLVGRGESGEVRGLVSFEGVMDFRIPPWQKPRPKGFAEHDPLQFLQPLFDAYAGPNRARDMANPLLHPILAPISTLPQNLFFIVGGQCILRSETEATIERLEAEAKSINAANGLGQSVVEEEGPDGRAVVVKSYVAEGQIHGWTEMPSFAIDVEKRTRAFGDAVRFLMRVHRAYGYVHLEA